jgi:hypothetical protein
MFFADSKKAISTKEMVIVFAIILLLFGMIFLTKLPQGSMGVCYAKNCYDLKTKMDCENFLQQGICQWNLNTIDKKYYCTNPECYNYKDKSSCNSNYFKYGCTWNNYSSTQGNCIMQNCNNIYTKSECDTTPKALYCSWTNSQCNSQRYIQVSEISQTCQKYSNKKAQCSAYNQCSWRPGGYGILTSGSNQAPFILWFVWTAINVFLILFLIALMGYGTLEQFPAMINLGIIAFAINIITRYIEFIIDFGGYRSLSLIFISGGILLIFGGWLIEKWRRSLMAKISEVPQNTPEYIEQAKKTKPSKRKRN